MGRAVSRRLLAAAVLLLVSFAGAPAGFSQEPARRPAVPAERLPVLGTVGDLPPEASRLVLEVDPLGALFLDGKSVDFAGFRKVLRARAPAGRDAKGWSPLFLVLRVDRDLPWQAVRWIHAECLAPEVRLRKILFAAKPEDGGEEGAMAAFLSGDAAPAPKGRVRVELRLRDMREPVGPSDVFAATKDLGYSNVPFHEPAGLSAQPRVATGDVLRTVDALLRGGATDVAWDGPVPEIVVDLEQALKGLPAAAGTLSPWVEGAPLRPHPEKARRAPPLARVRGSLAGVLTAPPDAAAPAAPPSAPEPGVTIAGSPGFLPTIGIVGDLPPADRRILIEVDVKGAIAVDGGRVPYESLDSVLSQAVRREARPAVPGLSGYHAVLRLDRRLPWGAALRILDHCGRTRPPLRRILFSALPEDGGPEGAVGAFAPVFTREGEHSREIREDRELVVFAGYSKTIEEGLQPVELLTFLEEKRGPMSADRAWMVRMRIIPDVPVGTTLSLYDMVLRWGTKCVVFQVEYNPKEEDLAGLVSILPPPKGKLYLSVTEGREESPIQPDPWGRHARTPVRRLQKWMAGLVDPDSVLLLPKPKPAAPDPGEEEK